MKVDMSPEAIENRLKLVGELTRACLRLRQNKLKNARRKLSEIEPLRASQQPNEK